MSAFMYNPAHHYWLRADGRVYSSARQADLSADDPLYSDWLAASNSPTPYPRDAAGNECATELAAVLAAYGLRAYPPGLEEAVAERCAAINAYRDERLAGGVAFRGAVYDSDDTSRLRLTAALLPLTQAAQSGSVPPSVDWVTKDNRTVSLSLDDLAALGQAIADHAAACVLTARRHKDALLALDSADAVAAYDFFDGWPG